MSNDAIEKYNVNIVKYNAIQKEYNALYTKAQENEIVQHSICLFVSFVELLL